MQARQYQASVVTGGSIEVSGLATTGYENLIFTPVSLINIYYPTGVDELKREAFQMREV